MTDKPWLHVLLRDLASLREAVSTYQFQHALDRIDMMTTEVRAALGEPEAVAEE